MAHARLPFRKAPRRDSRYRCFYQPARRTLAPATCNERFPISSPDWSQPATALRLVGIVAGTSCSASFAIPKSSTFTYPSGRSMMFSGLMSRWTIPACERRRAHSPLGSRRQQLHSTAFARASDVDAASRLRSVRWRCNELSDPRRSRKPSGYLDD